MVVVVPLGDGVMTVVVVAETRLVVVVVPDGEGVAVTVTVRV